MMKAYVVHEAGGLDRLKQTDIDTPNPGAGEVLVETKAISINPVDAKVRGAEPVLSMILGEDRPAILGWDIAGKVASVGKGMSGFAVGDSVFGMVRFPGHGKAYAEFVASPADQLALMPDGLSKTPPRRHSRLSPLCRCCSLV